MEPWRISILQGRCPSICVSAHAMAHGGGGGQRTIHLVDLGD